jgi:hypothetical protein
VSKGSNSLRFHGPALIARNLSLDRFAFAWWTHNARRTGWHSGPNQWKGHPGGDHVDRDGGRGSRFVFRLITITLCHAAFLPQAIEPTWEFYSLQGTLAQPGTFHLTLSI